VDSKTCWPSYGGRFVGSLEKLPKSWSSKRAETWILCTQDIDIIYMTIVSFDINDDVKYMKSKVKYIKNFT
jgi:hypothetical protein